MTKYWRVLTVPAVAGLVALQAITLSGTAAAEPCSDVEVVFARGTFEPAGVGRTGQAFVDALNAKAGGRSVEVYGVNYPASLDFATAADGVVDASNRVKDVAARCPNTKIVVGGYSQGAAVAAYITEDSIPQNYDLPAELSEPLPDSVAGRVAAVVLIAKPSSGFLQMIHRGAPPISVGPQYASKTLDLCLPQDPVCSPTGGDNGAHGQYAVNGMTDQAADYVVGKLNGGRAS